MGLQPRPRAAPDIACLERLGGQIGDLAAPIILPFDLDRERPVIERDHAIGIARLDRVEQRLVRQVGIALCGLEPRIEPVSRDARAVTMAELAEPLGKLVRIFHLADRRQIERSEEKTSELQSIMSYSY